MKFEVYDLEGTTPGFLKEKKDEFVYLLKNSKVYSDSNNLKYCINKIEEEDYIIAGALSQEYIGNLSTIDPNSKEEKEIGENPWEKTYFFIDIVTAKILIQKRRYSPKNLQHNRTVTRITEIINGIFINNFNSTISLTKTYIGQNNEFFKTVVRQEKVTALQVSNLLHKKIPVGTPLHNPKEEWDVVWAESWNSYDSEYVDKISLVAKDNGDLGKSVIQKALLAANGDIQKITYFDEEEEKRVTLNRNSIGTISIDAKTDEETPTIFKKATKKIKNSRDIIKSFLKK